MKRKEIHSLFLVLLGRPVKPSEHQQKKMIYSTSQGAKIVTAFSLRGCMWLYRLYIKMGRASAGVVQCVTRAAVNAGLFRRPIRLYTPDK
jgi:hypothetical protein